MRLLSAVDSSMSENMITTLPLGATRARSGRSTSAQSARFFVRPPHGRSVPVLAQDVAVCDTRLDCLPAAGEHSSHVDAATHFLGLAPAPLAATATDHQRHRLRRDHPRRHTPLSALRSPPQY